jgi:hypothetical protein
MSRSLETYSPKALAKSLGLPYRTILAAIKSGALECARINQRVFVIRSEAAAKWFVSLSNRNTNHK